MGNMGYCRFENTVEDLRDCQDNLWDTEDMSDSELRARKSLIRICKEIATEVEDYAE